MHARSMDCVVTMMVLLQNDRSQTDLITKLANVSMHNPEVLQQMYALYDGTQQSLENTPEITLFNNQLPGWSCCPVAFAVESSSRASHLFVTPC